jgi:hypothetical protein
MTQWLCGLLIATALVCLVFGVFRLAAWQVYVAIDEGSEPPEIATIIDEATMRHRRLVMLMDLVISSTITLFAIWTHRVSTNIHALGGQRIRFTPSWAIGWYLVPIANLWMPYLVMNEIWRVSKGSIDARSGRLPQWWWWCWLCWLAPLVGAKVVWLVPFHGFEALIWHQLLGIAYLALAIVGVGLAVALVRRICAFQVLAADRLLGAVFA